MILAAVAFMYTGVELSFWSGIYPTTVANTLKFPYNTYSLNAVRIEIKNYKSFLVDGNRCRSGTDML